VAEWLNAPHSKCGIGASLSGVRIPPSPPSILDSAEVLQKQAFLEPPEDDGVALSTRFLTRSSAAEDAIADQWVAQAAAGSAGGNVCGALSGARAALLMIEATASGRET
jgi:hypothetical protein